MFIINIPAAFMFTALDVEAHLIYFISCWLVESAAMHHIL